MCASTEPAVITGCGASWSAWQKWAASETLLENYGSLRFTLADDVELSLAEYMEYASSNEADSPYYLVERSFTGAHWSAA
eukprot:4303487-Pleurochrysis_carterae.AAC.1